MKMWVKGHNTYAQVFYDQYEKNYPLFFKRPSCHTEDYADYFDEIASGGWAIETCSKQETNGNIISPVFLSDMTLIEHDHMLLPNIHKSQGEAVEAILKSIDLAVESGALSVPEIMLLGSSREYIHISIDDEERNIHLQALIVEIKKQDAHDYWKKALVHAEDICEKYNGTVVSAENLKEAENA